MIPTIFGIIIAVVGVVLLVIANMKLMFALVIVTSLLGGAAAFSLPALGGSSIPPVQFALGFLALRCLLPGSGQGEFVRQAFRANTGLIIFVLYGVVLSYVGPRLFADDIMVTPMRYTGSALFATTALEPTSQNITAAVYLIGTMMCALGAYVACCNPGSGNVLVKVGATVACIHIFFGITDVSFPSGGYASFLETFRNGNYAQLDQHIGDFARMNGIFPEPSSFSTYGLGWFVFLFECWYRGIVPRLTGPIAVAMALTLAMSTSSTAYLGLGAYALLFFFRTIALPAGVASAKLVRIGLGVLAGAIAIGVLIALSPSLAAELNSILTTMTVGKQGSDSALQRSFWARQGLAAFATSFGLGIGPGSFRSSSQLTAVIGSMGIVGTVSFLFHVAAVFKPWRASTYNVITSRTNSIGVAAGWSALCLLITGGFISPTPDPGSDFAIMAGASLALRRRGSAASAAIDMPAASQRPVSTPFAPAPPFNRPARHQRSEVFGPKGNSRLSPRPEAALSSDDPS